MFNECRHILSSGHKCKGAALRGQAYCYFHTASRRYARRRFTSQDPIDFPSIEDAAGVQLALNQVLRGLGSFRIDPRHAGVYFYGLQIASRLAFKTDQKPNQTVREICETAELSADGSSPTGQSEILAPEKTICEPPDDCVHCRRRDFCKDFELWESDVEELEQRLEAEREAAESESAESASS